MVRAYVNVKLPLELIEEVDNIVREGLLGYRSRGEFVAEAVRSHIFKIKESLKAKQPTNSK